MTNSSQRAAARRYLIATDAGPAALVFDSRILQSQRPIIVLFHGAFRRAASLSEWLDRLQGLADVVLAELPGHGQAPPCAPPSLERFTELFSLALTQTFPGRPMVLAGESLGALVAASLSRLGPVVALDPLLTTAKLWPIRWTIETRRRHDPEFQADPDFIFSFFGYDAGGADVERTYHHVFEALESPAWLVAGDMPLLPVRALDRAPSLLEPEDVSWLAALPRVTLRMAPSTGHHVFAEAPDVAESVIREAVASLHRESPS